MNKKLAVVLSLGVLLLALIMRSRNLLLIPSNKEVEDSNNTLTSSSSPEIAERRPIFVLKDVGEAYMDFFGLDDGDFEEISKAGFDVIEGNFDICASDEDVKYFLETANKYGLDVIMPAGSGEAEWGYECDQEPGNFQKPVWQAIAVSEWISKWKSYENIYAWDTSNEAGSVMPNSDKDYYLTVEQLQKAYETVKVVDSRPVIIRMNGWYFYDNSDDFFREGNPFAENVADIVMINAYSNVEDYYFDFVRTVVKRASESIHEVDSDVELIVSLGTWEEKPLWYKPDFEELKNDFDSSLIFSPLGIAFFKYGATKSEWYLADHADLWQEIVMLIKK